MAQKAVAPHALILDGAGTWQDARWTLAVAELTGLLTNAGYTVDSVSPAAFTSPPAPDTLLAVPSLESLPLASYKAVAAFAAAGGSLMASGGEPFRSPLYLSADGQWLDRNSLLQTAVPAKTVLDPVTATLSQYFYVPQTVTRTTVAGPDGQSKALDFQLQMPVGTQNYVLTAPVSKPIFNEGQTATIVWTRGTPGQSMFFQWQETDGSIWIATVPLVAQWTKQVLLPSDFHFVQGGAPGRANTAFNPAQASVLDFGVGTPEGAQPGPLEFALSAISIGAAPVLESFTVPVLETLSPAYKQYVIQRAGQTVRIPIARGRGLSATPGPDGRYRAIGDLLSPAATWYVTNTGRVTIWLPWPQLQDPERSQLVALLSAVPNRLYLLNAGPAAIVTLPAEDVVLGGRALNADQSAAQATLNWSISDSTGAVAAQLSSTLNLAAGQVLTLPRSDIGQLRPGDYRVTARLVIGTQELDRVDSRVRVLDPTLNIQPDHRITVSNGTFSTAAGPQPFFLGVNYWPRYAAALEPARFTQSWLWPQNYDPDLIEADLSLLASLNFNLVSIIYNDIGGARSLIDFLDRCRNHGLWANIYINAFAGPSTPAILYNGTFGGVNRNIGPQLQAAFLSGNDRVFAYDLLWEPSVGLHADRLAFDSAWRAWITEQYGSLSNAETAWGFPAPRDAQGQISNPLDGQIENDGPWRVMVAAYRRFVDDTLSRAFGAAARVIRSVAPGTLLSYRNGDSAAVDANYSLSAAGMAMLNQMNYDIGTAAAHLDFFSPHAYLIPTPWPAGRGLGFAAAYARYRSAGKPVYWSEYGINIGANLAGLATQSAICDSVMQLNNDTGTNAAAVWWMPGGWRVDEQSDYGIINPDGSPRPCAYVLSWWGAQFAAAPPAPSTADPVKLTVDRDADARGDVGLFLRWTKDYVQAVQSGSPVVLADSGTGTDTSSMPLVQVGNVPYIGSGPLKYANGEFAGLRVQCLGLDVTVENGATVQVPANTTCQVTPDLVNTGQAAWASAAQSSAGVLLHTSLGDLPLRDPVAALQHTSLGSLQVAVGPSSLEIIGRLSIQGVGPFGETLHLSLATQ